MRITAYKTTIITLLCIFNNAFSNAIIKYSGNNADIKRISFNINGVLDSSFYTDKGEFFCNLDEPKKVQVTINGKVKRYIWADTGTTEFTINNKNEFIFKSNGINTDYNEYLKIIDSVNILTDSIKLIVRKMDTSDITTDHASLRENYLSKIQYLDSTKHELLYNWCIQHKKSFICFDFLEYQLQEKILPVEKLRHILTNLDTSLQNHASYLKYKKILKKNGYEIGDTIKNFTFQLNNKKTTDLFSINQKEYIYINFWTTDSNDSKRNHDLIAKFSKEKAIKDNITFISICLTEDEKKWHQLSIENKIDWINAIYDSAHKNNKSTTPSVGNTWESSTIANDFHIKHLPTDIILNKSNIVIENNIPSSYSGWIQLIYKTISKQ